MLKLLQLFELLSVHVLEIAMLVTEEDKVSLNLVKLGLRLKLQL